MRSVPLRRRLLLLAAAAIVPLALMSGIALQALLEQQRRLSEQASLDLTRALATAVDTELRLTVSALQSLALTEPFTSPGELDRSRAYDVAQRVLGSRREWRAILVAAPSGDVLLNTLLAPGAAAPRVTDAESLAEVFRSGAPVIGTLAGGSMGDRGIRVRIPILRDGEARYALTAIVRPESIQQVINRQRIADDWIVSVFDAKMNRVARSREHERFLGSPPSASLLALINRLGIAGESVGTSSTLEGERVETALVRNRTTGYVVALGFPSATIESAIRASALTYGGGLLLSLALGTLAAYLVARAVARPIAQLRDAALVLGRGEVVTPARSGVVELEAVSEALAGASTARQRSEAEREKLLDAEREARASAERARGSLQKLVTAGTLLSRSLEEATTLAAIAAVIVPDIADICRIDLLDKEGVLQRKLTHHVDPKRSAEIAAVVSKGVVSADTPGSFPRAIATGETYLHNFDEPAEAAIADPMLREFARTVDMRAVCVVPLVAHGRTIGAIGAVQAESARRFSAEDGALIGELAQRAALALDNVRLFAELRDALRDAQVANRAKDEFLAMLGHELRNPLAPIVTSLEVMARRAGPADSRERNVIARQVTHLSRMVDDLLDVSRIASGKIELSRERVDLRDVVAHALEMTEPALQRRGSAPRVSVPDGPVWVVGDALRLAQVLGNLIANAAKFSPVDTPIAIALTRHGSEARLSVADEGAGIAGALLPRVFDRFVQGEQALHRESGGLGLGLAIAKNLVELHGGSIRAESAGAGRGSLFTVALPLADDTAALPAGPVRASPAPAGRAARILVVDDNDDAAEALAFVLSMEGHVARVAHDGAAALRLLAEFVPDAAVLDIGLPTMSGYELAAALRADPRTRSIALIALTGYGRESDRRRALDAGFDEHLIKPVDADRLLQALDRLLSREG